MSDIKQKLDKVREFVQTPEFLNGKGLSNEVNIRMFCYEPKDEMIVKHFIGQITTDTTISCHLVECNLYKIFLEACKDIDILNAIPDMEESEGSTYLLEQLHSTIGEDVFVEKIKTKCPQDGDVIMITGVGEAFPFMRVHTLLEALQPYFSDNPILVMYPGTFDKHQVKLFNRLKPNDYYRAFNII